MASNSQPTTTTGAGGRNGHGDKEEAEQTPPPPEEATTVGGGDGVQFVMPEDGYEWKKYGQKFIKNIQKNRSYFRCREQRCGAKKKVEWHPHDPSLNLRVVYDGAHQHGSPSAAGEEGGGGATANQYDLSTQYFGGGPRSH
ncbi:WRKY transcription factor WRKY24-like [Oryza brachyantha]|uniref:WRKY domain-containing protein n=1 Tax=Oryza brachyantha TaxID=4533 RepID=J3LRA7_ORYBR|nr:WRKY transcription factor WRKY24-like [Oryza brachyantha]